MKSYTPEGTQEFNMTMYQRLKKPTKHLPGTRKKFQLLCLRMKYGVSLWVKGDAGTEYAKPETATEETARRAEIEVSMENSMRPDLAIRKRATRRGRDELGRRVGHVRRARTKEKRQPSREGVEND